MSLATPSSSSSAAIRFTASACASASSVVNHGADSFRQIEVEERAARVFRQEIDPVRARDPFRDGGEIGLAERAISAGRPPMRSAQRNPSSASSTHSIEGVLMVAPLNMSSISLPPEISRKIFGSGRGGA